MDESWIHALLFKQSVAHAVLILSLVSVLGLALGRIKIFGISMGIAGVFFAGIFLAHFKMTADGHILEFVREFGLILFVYAVGQQVGPGFAASLRKQGLKLNLMAVMLVSLGVLTTVAVVKIGKIDPLVGVGLYSGATTNTPSMAASQQTIKDAVATRDISAAEKENLRNKPGIGFALTYPCGIMGLIMGMYILKWIFRIDPAKEAEELQKSLEHKSPPLMAVNLEVTNPNLAGVTVSAIPSLSESRSVISRIHQQGQTIMAHPDTALKVGDILLAVGPKEGIQKLQVVIGRPSSMDLKAMPSRITSRKIIVSNPRALGKTADQLDLTRRYGVTITRVIRAEIELPASSEVPFQYGDQLVLVGEEESLLKAVDEVGTATKKIPALSVIPMFIGIALGVILGAIPFQIPHLSAPVKLGIAGGPMIMAIILSRLGNIGPIIWYMPHQANHMLREFGIVLFLACVGLQSGEHFVENLQNGPGFAYIGYGALITMLPSLIVLIFSRTVLKLNYSTICGMIAGSSTAPPALAFAQQVTGSDTPNLAYATAYPLTMLLRIFTAQVMVLVLM